MPLISFIVPVYNTGKYVARCLDSIFEQTDQEDFEIIIINDGSTDDSSKQIEEYMVQRKEDSRIQYYSNEHAGIAQTRNFGIEKATGEYVLFIDSDDYIAKDSIEKLKPYLDQKIDMIKFQIQQVDEQGNLLQKIESPVIENKTGEEAFHDLYSRDVLLVSPCLYFIKKELFTRNNFYFQQTYHEDFGLIPLLILKAKTFVSTPYYLYFYVQVENSIMRNQDYQKTVKKMEDSFAHYDFMLKAIESMELGKQAKEDVKIFYTNAILLELYELKKEDQNQFIREIKSRKMHQNIKIRNAKQLLKRMMIYFSVKLYLKMR